MFKKIFILFLLIICFPVYALQTGEWDLICTGFFVSPNGLVLTAAHCITKHTTFFIEYKNKAYKVTVKKIDRVHDIAILQTHLKPTYVFSLQPKWRRSETVFVTGYPIPEDFGYQLKMDEGIIIGIEDDGIKTNLTTGLGCKGESGGPVLNSNNEVVGILIEGVNGAHSNKCGTTIIYTPIQEAINLLKSIGLIFIKDSSILYSKQPLFVKYDVQSIVIVYGVRNEYN